MAIDKEQIYKQIDEFNNKTLAKNVTVCENYFYVDTIDANDCSSFVKFLNDKTSFILKKPKILDLAFGSGNLTSHIAIDNFEDFSKITFNDINDEVNIELIEKFDKKAELSTNSILEASRWNKNQKDIIIFNPQIGGDNYTKGDSKLEKQSVIISKQSFEDYLIEDKAIETKDLEIKTNDAEKEIYVYSESHKVKELDDIFKNIKIYNYYDVLYKNKAARKKKGTKTNTVKFRATFDKVFNPNGIVLFYGDDDAFNSLFADFNTVYKYTRLEKNLYIALKQGEVRVIEEYCKYDDGFDIYRGVDKIEKVEGDISKIQVEIGEAIKELAQTTQTDNSLALEEKPKPKKTKSEPFGINIEKKGKLELPYKNILLKGVPGTGKSRLIDKTLLVKLGLNTLDEDKKNSFTYDNILRINVHSASSNADLMQGIGLSTNTDNQIEYKEKQGLILHKLKQAIAHPNQPFAIILEEVQENSLNELIGDLIYLIEDEKRTDIGKYIKENEGIPNKEYVSFEAFVNELTTKQKDVHFVEIPYLVSNEKTKYRKLIVPNNLYFFCTSNYRDDKKVIEDNLLRRFTVLELYPKSEVIIDQDVQAFLKKLNEGIIKEFENKEIHPDRFLIGHAYWINVNDEKSFCAALLKTITEFKDIREVEFLDIKKALGGITLPFVVEKDTEADETPEGDQTLKLEQKLVSDSTSYKDLIDKLQKLAFNDILA